MIVLARLLSPSSFGLIAIVMAIIGLASVLANFGLPQALIQSPSHDDSDMLTATLFAILLSILIYTFIFAFAAKLSFWYNAPELYELVILGALVVFPMSAGAVQRAILQRALNFKAAAQISIISNLISGLMSISWAFYKPSVYVLVANLLMVNTMSCILLTWQSSEFYSAKVSIKRLLILTKYSYKILLGNLFDAAALHLYPLILGTVVSKQQLGFYHSGRQIPSVIASVINGAISSVVFPELAKIQTYTYRIKTFAKQTIISTSFIVTTILGSVALNANYIIQQILGEQWIGSVIYFQLFCVYFSIHHLQSLNLLVCAAVGRADIFLKFLIINRSISIGMLYITAGITLKVVVIGQIISVFLSFIINSYASRSTYNYNLKEQLLDLLPIYFSAGLAYFAVDVFSNGLKQSFIGLIFAGLSYAVFHLVLSSILSKSFRQFIVLGLSYIFQKVRI